MTLSAPRGVAAEVMTSAQITQAGSLSRVTARRVSSLAAEANVKSKDPIALFASLFELSGFGVSWSFSFQAPAEFQRPSVTRLFFAERSKLGLFCPI
jgi:hypothetical protein